MNDNKLGRQIRVYRYNRKRYFVMIIFFLAPLGIIWLRVSSAIDSDSTLLVLGLLSIAIISIVTLLEWKYMKQRIIVHQNGLRLKTHKYDVSCSITNITNMQFNKYERHEYNYLFRRYRQHYPPIFSLFVELKDESYFEINLAHFESLFARLTSDNETIPALPELLAFHDRWIEIIKQSKG